MQIAGLAHGICDDECPMQDDEDRAKWAQMMEMYERAPFVTVPVGELDPTTESMMKEVIVTPPDPNGPKLTTKLIRDVVRELRVKSAARARDEVKRAYHTLRLARRKVMGPDA